MSRAGELAATPRSVLASRLIGRAWELLAVAVASGSLVVSSLQLLQMLGPIAFLVGRPDGSTAPRLPAFL